MSINYYQLPEQLKENRYILLYGADFKELKKVFNDCSNLITIPYPRSNKYIITEIDNNFLDESYKKLSSKTVSYLVKEFRDHFIQYYEETPNKSKNQKLSLEKSNENLKKEDHNSKYRLRLYPAQKETVETTIFNFEQTSNKNFMKKSRLNNFPKLFNVNNSPIENFEQDMETDNIITYPLKDSIFKKDDTLVLLIDNFSSIRDDSYIIFYTLVHMRNVYIVANTYETEFSQEVKKGTLSYFTWINKQDFKYTAIKQPYFLFIAIILGMGYLASAFLVDFQYTFTILGTIWIITSWYKYENYAFKKI
ncbi:hypothetical protein [uncultured Methanobrevibacter sp.]|uniref:hypothetical protein n=1 Tax=uncultured Methanobrevibacter sp. TaxID=253161 RepID=UPI0025D21607|nr:hypothetical protein [uncultured Methanobrevibacter sp.]